MRVALRTVLAALPLLLPIAALAAGAEAPHAITVTGEASVSAQPDMAEIDGGVTTQAKTAREATDSNNKAMTAVIAGLKKAGVADADIRTSRLSLQPDYPANRVPGYDQVTGYHANNRVTIRVHDVARVADTIDTLLAAGANDLGGVSFQVSNASQLLDDARPRAIADARRKAEIYAKAAGVAVGAPLSISEANTGPPVPRFLAGRALAATPIASGDETLTVSITVSYELKPAQ